MGHKKQSYSSKLWNDDATSKRRDKIPTCIERLEWANYITLAPLLFQTLDCEPEMRLSFRNRHWFERGMQRVRYKKPYKANISIGNFSVFSQVMPQFSILIDTKGDHSIAWLIESNPISIARYEFDTIPAKNIFSFFFCGYVDTRGLISLHEGWLVIRYHVHLVRPN